jgi:trans-aconitate methyltransferase
MTFKNHQQFYNDPKLYDKILGEHDLGELEYYKKLASKTKSLLFLGPGTGRLLKEVCGPDRVVVGVEKSENMCVACRQNAPQAEIINQDVLELNLKERFDLAVAPYEFLNHFDSKHLPRVLGTVAKHLKRCGNFVAQLKNPYHCIGRVHQSELDYVELAGKNVLERGYITYNNSQQTYTDIIERVPLDGGEHDVITMDWYYYLIPQLESYFLKSGLKIKRLMGNFKRAKFAKTSPLLIVEAQKSDW